jgi:hypothetical protein
MGMTWLFIAAGLWCGAVGFVLGYRNHGAITPESAICIVGGLILLGLALVVERLRRLQKAIEPKTPAPVDDPSKSGS